MPDADGRTVEQKPRTNAKVSLQYYYDLDNNPGYIAGFFSTIFPLGIDRNVVTIDAFDWQHRLGPNPPNDPNPGDLCTDRPARPFLYEAVLAHEYQHLIHYDYDPRETT